jgi:hypothetical protein
MKEGRELQNRVFNLRLMFFQRQLHIDLDVHEFNEDFKVVVCISRSCGSTFASWESAFEGYGIHPSSNPSSFDGLVIRTQPYR